MNAPIPGTMIAALLACLPLIAQEAGKGQVAIEETLDGMDKFYTTAAKAQAAAPTNDPDRR